MNGSCPVNAFDAAGIDLDAYDFGPTQYEFRLYDLRHTCATLLLLADVPAKMVSERLGHGSIAVTLDTYSHVLPTMQRGGGHAGRLRKDWS